MLLVLGRRDPRVAGAVGGAVPDQLALRAHLPAVGRRRSPGSAGGFPLTSASNILVLGSDRRQKNSKEPGAETTGFGRSDTIMLIRTGGGHAARLSIPRDTVVEIPGHGLQKINAAHAFGGPALSISVIEHWLGSSDQPPGGSELRKLPPADRRDGGRHLQGRMHRLEDQRRLPQRGLHAAAARRHPSPRRQAGARARAHPQEPVRAERDRHPARAAPAGAVQRDEVAPALALELPAPAADRLERAAGDHLRHERPRTARAVRRRSRSAGHPPTRVL